MKIRDGFVANSSSTSFVLLVDPKDGGAKITIPNITTVNLTHMYSLYDNEDHNNAEYSYYRYNWVPETLQECIDECILYLKKAWIRRLMFNNELNKMSVNEYATRAADTVSSYMRKYDENNKPIEYDRNQLIKYFVNEFGYIANTYDLLTRMLKDYWENFLLPKVSSLQEYISRHEKDKHWYYKNFYKHIMDIDNSECFSFQQYVCNFSIHNKGIYMVNPISHNGGDYTVFDTSVKDKSVLEKNGVMWYNSVVEQITRVKKVLMIYLYCHFTGNMLQNMIIEEGGSSSDLNKLNEVVLGIYDSTKFVRPIANFDVIDVARE